MRNNYQLELDGGDPAAVLDAEASPAPAESISQARLQEFHAVKQRKDEADDEYQKHRAVLLRLHHAGIPVEPGALSLTVKEVQRRSLSKGAVCAAFGEAEYERLVIGIEKGRTSAREWDAPGSVVYLRKTRWQEESHRLLYSMS